jgi:hypothetical protein
MDSENEYPNVMIRNQRRIALGIENNALVFIF